MYDEEQTIKTLLDILAKDFPDFRFFAYRVKK